MMPSAKRKRLKNSAFQNAGNKREYTQAFTRRAFVLRVLALASLYMAGAALFALRSGLTANPSPIHFSYRPIAFALDSSETPETHAPATMAGGVAVLNYDNHGYLDIFFTNGADISSLKKTSPKYWNRLFHNNGDEDIFVGGGHRNSLYHNNGNGTFTDVTEKAGLARPDKESGPLWSVGGAWVDVNNDGLLDLFVVNYLAWDIQTEPSCEAGPGKLDYCHPKF